MQRAEQKGGEEIRRSVGVLAAMQASHRPGAFLALRLIDRSLPERGPWCC
jgi:hypothetical protein